MLTESCSCVSTTMEMYSLARQALAKSVPQWLLHHSCGHAKAALCQRAQRCDPSICRSAGMGPTQPAPYMPTLTAEQTLCLFLHRLYQNIIICLLQSTSACMRIWLLTHPSRTTKYERLQHSRDAMQHLATTPGRTVSLIFGTLISTLK